MPWNPSSSVSRPSEAKGYLIAILAIASLVVIVLALHRYNPVMPVYWSADAALDLAIWISGVLLLALALRIVAPVTARPLIVAGLAGYLALGVGIGPAIAVALLFGSALLYGRGVLALVFRAGPDVPGWSQSIFVGLAVVLAMFGLAVHVPVNYRVLYGVVLALPFACLLRPGLASTVRQELRLRIHRGARILDAMPYGYLVLVVALAAVTARYAFFPTVGYDENAHHLRLWTELALHHRYSFDVVTQVWEVAPFSVAMLHAIASLCAGEDARGALNLALLLLMYTQVWGILTHFPLKQQDRALMLLVLASTPMLASLLGTLQAELFLATLIAGGTRVVMALRRPWISSGMLAVFAVAALCVATKLPGAVAGVLLIGAAFMQVGSIDTDTRVQPTLRHPILLALAIVVLSITALGAYAYAWKATGNPFFPLYNGIFKSPFFEAVNFSDRRWNPGFTLQSYWNVFFRTSSFNESKDFVAGFQYLFLPLIALLGLSRSIGRKALPVLIALAGFGIVMFYMTQYWRYMFPVFPLATVLIGTLFRDNHDRWLPMLRSVVLACIALNLYFLPGISWVFDNASPQQAYTEARKTLIANRYAAPKQLTAYVNDRYPGATVLYPGSAPFGATLRGSPIYTNWYAPTHQAALAAAHDDTAIRTFLKQRNVGFVIWSTFDSHRPGSPEWTLRDYLSRTAYPEMRLDNYTLYRLTDHDLPYRDVLDVRAQTGHDSTVISNPSPQPLATFAVDRATALRYRLTLRCDSPKGRLVVAFRWDTGGDSYYRLVPCDTTDAEFSESLPVPVGATRAELHLASQDTPQVVVTNMKMESN